MHHLPPRQTWPALALAVWSLLILALPAPAQVTLVRGSGCPGASMPLWSGTAKLGTTFTVLCPSGGANETYLGILGAALPQLTDIGPPVTCVARCKLATSILLVQGLGSSQPQWPLKVPANPSLVGVVFRVQCAANLTTRRCIDLRGALEARITR